MIVSILILMCFLSCASGLITPTVGLERPANLKGSNKSISTYGDG